MEPIGKNQPIIDFILAMKDIKSFVGKRVRTANNKVGGSISRRRLDLCCYGGTSFLNFFHIHSLYFVSDGSWWWNCSSDFLAENQLEWKFAIRKNVSWSPERKESFANCPNRCCRFNSRGNYERWKREDYLKMVRERFKCQETAEQNRLWRYLINTWCPNMFWIVFMLKQAKWDSLRNVLF